MVLRPFGIKRQHLHTLVHTVIRSTLKYNLNDSETLAISVKKLCRVDE